jgi:peptidoglycan/xylan/chitin deacetylase (PgdA/CDA1 family)/folate-dependent phosphoribosylglycinamide formyltransferase PurN
VSDLPRAVILSCGNLGIEVANALAADAASKVVGLVTTPYRMRNRTLWGKIRLTIRIDGWIGALKVAFGKIAKALHIRDGKIPEPNSSLRLASGVPHFHFDDFHHDDARSLIKSLQPDILVIAGTYILKESVFSLARNIAVNLHTGKAPQYRGAAPVFWELYNGETQVGITIHRVVAAVDAGGILTQELFPLNPAPPGDPVVYVERYRNEVLRPHGVRLLVQTVRAIAEGTVHECPQNAGEARTYRSPDRRAVKELRRRVMARRNAVESFGRRRVKALLGRLMFASGIYQFFFRNKAVIVLFHRIDDRYVGDPITYPAAGFRNFLKFFRRYFTVVPLSELIEKLNRGEDISRHIVITFDDGYRDNRRAADELLRHQLPACFFIATDFIGTDRIPWWDADAAITSEWMSWDEVRSLRRDGFELGSHTRNHIDLGIVSGDEAREEILGAAQRLAEETGETLRMFSYPYGRVHQLSEENRDLVRRSGFVCCPSAYGGNVRRGDDPFKLCRTPIAGWQISAYQFGFEAMME